MFRKLLVLALLLVAAPCYGQIYSKTAIWGEFANSDSTAATLSETTARIALYEMVGTTPTAVTLAATDFVEITDVISAIAATSTLAIYSGPDDTLSAGDQMYKCSHASAGTTSVTMSFRVPPRALIGTYPKVEASAAGNTSVYIRGWLNRVNR